jgi:hypothetical protein
MVQHSITFTTGIAALGTLLLLGAGPVLSNPAPTAKDQSRMVAVPAEPGRPAGGEANNPRVTSLPFSDCLGILAEVSKETGVRPLHVVSTDDLRVTRFEAADGVLTISCNRQQGRMVLTKHAAPAASTVVAAR